MKKKVLSLIMGIFLISLASAGLYDDNTLVSYYTKDDNVANTVVTDSTDFYNGTLLGGKNTQSVSVIGLVNRAFTYDGSFDRVKVINSTGTVFSSSICFTIRYGNLFSFYGHIDSEKV